MARPIIFTKPMKQQARQQLEAMLDGIKMSDGKLNYSHNYKYEDTNAIVWLAPEAYQKILALVTEFSDEVAWHGSVTRSGDNEFTIEDIFVYPQEVTGSTVNTEQIEYSKWLYELDDETFSKLRMQGHSHVNMGVNPSGVDDKHRQQILGQLEKDMFYIFMIWNKSLSVHTLVYDMSRNVLYENDDVEVMLLNGDDIEEFLDDAREKVQKKSQGGNKYMNNSEKETAKQMSLCEDFEDYDNDYYGMYYPHYLGGNRWKH